MDSKLKVLIMAAEATPFVKVGGLGDVAGSLPRALLSLGGIDVRLAIPYHQVDRSAIANLQTVSSFDVPHSSGPIRAEVYSSQHDGLIVYFVAGAPIPPDGPVYSNDDLRDGHKFTFFSLAALELIRRLDWIPDVIHANDWHTAPAIYALWLRQESWHARIATLFGLHNLPYMGNGAGPAMEAFGLPPASRSALPYWAQDVPLALGLLAAEHIVTVSPTYAREILTPDFSHGLEGFLQSRAKDITGILNGIDTREWNPADDPFIVANYTASSLDKRILNKQSLLQKLSLPEDPSLPLLAMIARLDYQKGVDLLPDALRQIAHLPWQMVFLGSGSSSLEAMLQELESEFPRQIRVVLRYDAELSHQIYAGADGLLIPSRYEPCGLTQMIAMRYGCVPIAHATGGLVDTIQDYHAGSEGTGFLFPSATPTELAATIQRALTVFNNPPEWRKIQARGMATDFGWERSARQYLACYDALVKQHRMKL